MVYVFNDQTVTEKLTEEYGANFNNIDFLMKQDESLIFTARRSSIDYFLKLSHEEYDDFLNCHIYSVEAQRDQLGASYFAV